MSSKKKRKAERKLECRVKQKLKFIIRDQKQMYKNFQKLLNDPKIEKVDKIFSVYRMVRDEAVWIEVGTVLAMEGYCELIRHARFAMTIINKGVEWEDLRKISLSKWKGLSEDNNCYDKIRKISEDKIYEGKKEK